MKRRHWTNKNIEEWWWQEEDPSSDSESDLESNPSPKAKARSVPPGDCTPTSVPVVKPTSSRPKPSQKLGDGLPEPSSSSNQCKMPGPITPTMPVGYPVGAPPSAAHACGITVRLTPKEVVAYSVAQSKSRPVSVPVASSPVRMQYPHVPQPHARALSAGVNRVLQGFNVAKAAPWSAPRLVKPAMVLPKNAQ